MKRKNTIKKIDESKFDVTVVNKKTSSLFPVEVMENPSTGQIISMMSKSTDNTLRGLSTGDSIFVWDAGIAIHSQIIVGLSKIGIPTDMNNVGYFYLRKQKSNIIFEEVGINSNSLQNKNLQSLLKSSKVFLDAGTSSELTQKISQMIGSQKQIVGSSNLIQVT